MRRRRNRSAVAAVLAAGLALGVSGVATGATATRSDGGASLVVQESSLTRDQVSVRLSAQRAQGDGLAEALELQDDVSVTASPANGGSPTPLTPRTSRPAEASGTRVTVMLALDVSGSMEGDKFAAELAAADSYVASIGKLLAGNVEVGLLTFDSNVELRARPTPDLTRIRQLISRLKTGSNTALYQAINDAAAQLPQRGQRALVVVTDGDNDPTGKTLTGADKTRQAQLGTRARQLLNQRSNRIDFTGILIQSQDERRRDDLSPLAPKNTVLTNSSPAKLDEQLNLVFATSARKIARQVRVSAPLPAELQGQSVKLTVRATPRGGDPIERTFVVPLDQTASAGAPTSQALPIAKPSLGAGFGSPVVIGSLVAVFLGLTALAFVTTGAITSREAGESEISRRLAFYTLRGNRGVPVPDKDEASTRLGDSRLVRSAINVVNRVARQRQLEDALDSRLEAAGLPMRTAEWTLLHLGCAVGGALLLLVAARGMVVGAVIGLVLGLALPWIFLSLRTGARERKFLAQLPDTLQLLAGSLAAGYSLPQAMDAVLRESEAPISTEFNRALIETRLGMPPEDALEGIGNRTASKDFAWVVIAIRIQRDVGGNLAELLSSVADTLRERQRLRRQVSSLSAEGKLSGFILGALPLVFGLFLLFTKPDYIAPLFEQPLGLMLLAVGALLLAAGAFWMSRLVKVDV